GTGVREGARHLRPVRRQRRYRALRQLRLKVRKVRIRVKATHALGGLFSGGGRADAGMAEPTRRHSIADPPSRGLFDPVTVGRAAVAEPSRCQLREAMRWSKSPSLAPRISASISRRV